MLIYMEVLIDTSKINYDNLTTKIRVEYQPDEKTDPEIGDLVKIQFRDKNSFYDPYIIGVEKVAKNYIQQIEPGIKEYKKYQDCKILNLDFPTEIGKVSIDNILRPAGGYIQALRQLDNKIGRAHV